MLTLYLLDCRYLHTIAGPLWRGSTVVKEKLNLITEGRIVNKDGPSFSSKRLVYLLRLAPQCSAFSSYIHNLAQCYQQSVARCTVDIYGCTCWCISYVHNHSDCVNTRTKPQGSYTLPTRETHTHRVKNVRHESLAGWLRWSDVWPQTLSSSLPVESNPLAPLHRCSCHQGSAEQIV